MQKNGVPQNNTSKQQLTTSYQKCIQRIHSTDRIPQQANNLIATQGTSQVIEFNTLNNKTMAITQHDAIDPQEAIYDMPQAYRSTQHPATKTPPYQLLMNDNVRRRLDHFPVEQHTRDQKVRENNHKYNETCKE